jgi:membrane protease YdiL (CAAX protease family)
VTELGSTILPEDITLNLLIVGMIFSLILGAGLVVDLLLFVHILQKPPRWRDRIREIQARPWNWREAMGLFALLIAAFLAINVISVILPSESDRPTALMLFLRSSVLHFTAFVAIIALLVSRRTPLRRALGLRWNKAALNIGQGITFYLGIMPLIGVAACAYAIVLKAMNFPLEKQEVMTWFSNPELPLWFRAHLVIVALIVAPVVEELVFRGILLPTFTKHSRPWLAVCFVSLLFAFMHPHLPSLVPLFLLAVGFSVAYIYSGSILVPIVMHATFNAMSLTAHFLLKGIAPCG